MGIVFTIPISLNYWVRDKYAVNTFEIWRNLPVLGSPKF